MNTPLGPDQYRQKRNAQDDDALRKMQRKLYEKKDTLPKTSRKKFSPEAVHTIMDWDDKDINPEEIEKVITAKPRKRMTVYTKMLIGAFLFFIGSLGAMALIFFLGQNEVSYGEVDILIQGPSSIPSGEVFAYDVIIQNNNPVDIVLADLYVDYPGATFKPNSVEEGELRRDTVSIDRLQSGANTTARFEASFFGEEKDTKPVKITLQYRVPDSSTILFKERVYNVGLTAAPISIKVDSPTQVVTGNSVSSTVTIRSNANRPLENLVLEIDYPFGFTFATSSIPTVEGNESLFALDEIEVGGSQVVSFEGMLAGQDEESRVFNYAIGLANAEKTALATILEREQTATTIIRPPIALRGTIGGLDQSLYVQEEGTQTRLNLEVRNNTSFTARDIEVVLSLSGNGYLPSAVTSDGFYKTREGEVVWNRSTTEGLGTLEPGESVNLITSVPLKGLRDITRLIDPSVELSYVLRGKTSDATVTEEGITTRGSKTLRIPTELDHESIVLFSQGPFQNEGSIQVSVNEPNTYTVVWNVRNSSSKVEDLVVEGKLPIYVDYVEAVNIDGSVFSYDETSKVVTWNIDEVAPGAGYGRVPAPEGVFKIRVTPSESQQGDVIDLVIDKSVIGVDTYTGLERTAGDISDDTADLLRRDPAYVRGAELVE